MYTYIHINTSLNEILSETFINCILHQLPTQQDSSWYNRLHSDVDGNIFILHPIPLKLKTAPTAERQPNVYGFKISVGEIFADSGC